MDISLEQLVTAIEFWNYSKAGKKGQFSAPVHDILSGAELFAKLETEWVYITKGPLSDSRYVKTIHGYVVQSPQPSNEISLVQENIAKVMGII